MSGADRWGLVLLPAILFGFLLLQGADPFPVRERITGEVHDAHGPVRGACVRFQGEAGCAVTDAHGRFRLPVSSPAPERVTATREGYFIAGTSLSSAPLRLRLQPLPERDNPDYAWVAPVPGPSGQCANCHAEIYREWSLSAHARSGSGRRFRNLYEGTDWNGQEGHGWNLLAEHPFGAGVCASCHAPSAPPGTDMRQLAGVDAHGVHCDYCHKVKGSGAGPLGLTFGNFNLDLLRPTTGQVFFGPLPDVDRGEDVYSPLYKKSLYCASCHEGVVFGVHVYGTYSEWLDSPARREGKECQDCHMKPTGAMTNIAPGKGGRERDPGTLGNHRFFAGSREEMLRRCLTASARFTQTGEGVEAEVVLLAAGVGHRVPTGFIDRHLVLLVEGRAGDGQPVAVRAGPLLPLPAGKALVGKPGKLYAKLLRDEDGHSPAPFWAAVEGAEDTRLQPGEPDVLRFRFAPGLKDLRVRLLYRPFWDEVAREKSWPDDEVVVLDRLFRVKP